MFSKIRLFSSACIGLCLPMALLAVDAMAEPARLTAPQIVEKYLAARGGAQTLRGVKTMSWNGKMDAGFGDSVARSQRYVGNTMLRTEKQRRDAIEKSKDQKPAEKQVQVPFVLEMKRPGKSRIEIVFDGKTAIQVYDGKEGWMKRPFLNRDDWEPFSAEQTKSQAGNWDLDGPLLDYAAKGTKVELEGSEAVEGHDAYRLKVTKKDGTVRHVWIDAQSFLDVKVEGIPRRMDGKMRTVWVYQRDFRPVQGLMVPFTLETAVDGYRDTHMMVIEKVGLNPDLADSLFVRPKS
jgi:outer membrane lipoprotein-sorting protein